MRSAKHRSQGLVLVGSEKMLKFIAGRSVGLTAEFFV
jgi:hypothetical protein